MDVGSDKIEDELNVVKIMNDLRNLKILLENTYLTNAVMDKIKHTGNNIIDLDSESSSDSHSDDKEKSLETVRFREQESAMVGNN